MPRIPKSMPVFRCTAARGRDVDLWQFWCPYCRRFHVHSAEPGHRVAHCGTGSPYADSGYWLVGPDASIAERREP